MDGGLPALWGKNGAEQNTIDKLITQTCIPIFSNAGGLGILGAGSMYPDVLREHIKKCKLATDKPFAVNVPLLVPGVEEYMKIIAEEGVQIVFTSAGNPKSWTGELKKRNIKGMYSLLFIATIQLLINFY